MPEPNVGETRDDRVSRQRDTASWWRRWSDGHVDGSGIVLSCRVGVKEQHCSDVVKILESERFSVLQVSSHRGLAILDVSDSARITSPRRGAGWWGLRWLRGDLQLRDSGQPTVIVPRAHVSSLRRRIFNVVNRDVSDAMVCAYGAVADERLQLGVIPSALVTRDEQEVIARGLALSRGQSLGELEQEALTAWGRGAGDGRLLHRSVTEWRLLVPAVVTATLVAAILQLTVGSPRLFAPMFLGLCVAIALLEGPRVWRGLVPAFRALVGNADLLSPLGTAAAAVIAWHPYATFSRRVGISPRQMGLEWQTILLPAAPILLGILIAAGMSAFVTLAIFEAFSDPCRAGSVRRRQTGGKLAALVVALGLLAWLWTAAGRAGDSAGREMIAHFRPPEYSPWLPALDVRLVTLQPVSPQACGVTPDPNLRSSLLLGDDGQHVQVLVGRPHESRLEQHPVDSVAVCDSEPIAP